MPVDTFFNPIPGATSSFLEDLQTFLREEDADRFHEQFTDFVVSGGTHGTVAGLTGTPTALIAYPAGHRITESGSITYPDATSFVWVIADAETTGDLAGFTRVAGTHYLIQSAGAQPALPSGAVWLMKVTTAAGAITAVTDLRTLSSLPGVIFNDSEGDPADVGLAAADGTSQRAARRDHVHKSLPYVPAFLTNKTGVALAVGDVVGISSGTDDAVALDDTAASVGQFVVALEAVADNAVGAFAKEGYVAKINVTGAVTRKHYLVKSATTKVVADSGTAADATTQRPQGTLAISASADVGGACSGLLLGFTERGILESTLRSAFRNLVMRTHPDNDVAAHKAVFTADEIVLDDGTRLTGWDVTLDLAAAGAGGLDTGTEQVSTWYEVYASGNGAGTKSGFLHRAKNYSADTSFTTARDASRALRIATATASDKLAQGIQFSNPGKLVFIDVELIRAGAVSGNIWFSIQASSSGDADGTPIATTDKINAAGISTSAQIIRLIFRAPTTPAVATQYHLVLEGDYTRSDAVNIAWRGVAAGGYASGVARQYNGTSWAAATGVGDFYFKAFIVLNDVAVTMPSGHTGKCLLGYLYNDGSSNLTPSLALNRRCKRLANAVDSGAVAAALPTLIDFSAVLPPVPCQALFDGYSSVLEDVLGVGGVPDGFVITPPGASFMRLHTSGTDMGDSVLTEYQAVYLMRNNGSGNVQLRIRGFEW